MTCGNNDIEGSAQQYGIRAARIDRLENIAICLGTMTYGTKQWREWVLDEEAGRPFIRRT